MVDSHLPPIGFMYIMNTCTRTSYIIPSNNEEEEEVSTISTSVNSGSKSGANHMQLR